MFLFLFLYKCSDVLDNLYPVHNNSLRQLCEIGSKIELKITDSGMRPQSNYRGHITNPSGYWCCWNWPECHALGEGQTCRGTDIFRWHQTTFILLCRSRTKSFKYLLWISEYSQGHKRLLKMYDPSLPISLQLIKIAVSARRRWKEWFVY